MKDHTALLVLGPKPNINVTMCLDKAQIAEMFRGHLHPSCALSNLREREEGSSSENKSTFQVKDMSGHCLLNGDLDSLKTQVSR